MKLTDLFVKRPVLAIVVNLVILIAGLQSIRSLSVRQYPRSDIAVISVTTVYVGANADLVRGFITTPLERVIASADGIDYMESQSAQSLSTIIVHLKLNYDTTAALTQIQSKLAQVRNDLPPESQQPVIDLQTADSQFAAMYIGFASKDGKDGADADVDVDIAAAVERIEDDDVLAVLAVALDDDGVFVFFRRHDGHVAAIAQKLQQRLVGDDVELLHGLALHVGLAGDADDPG